MDNGFVEYLMEKNSNKLGNQVDKERIDLQEKIRQAIASAIQECNDTTNLFPRSLNIRYVPMDKDIDGTPRTYLLEIEILL